MPAYRMTGATRKKNPIQARGRPMRSNIAKATMKAMKTTVVTMYSRSRRRRNTRAMMRMLPESPAVKLLIMPLRNAAARVCVPGLRPPAFLYRSIMAWEAFAGQHAKMPAFPDGPPGPTVHPMDNEQVNAIGTLLADLSERTQQLRGYL